MKKPMTEMKQSRIYALIQTRLGRKPNYRGSICDSCYPEYMASIL